MESYFTIAIMVLVFIGLIVLFFVLIIIDSNKDYCFETIEKYLIQEEPLKLCIPYAVWQEHKKAVIIENTCDIVTYGNRKYVVTSSLTDEEHVSRKNDLLPAIFYRDVMLTLKFIDEYESHRTTINVFGDIERIEIIDHLEKIISNERYDEEIRSQLQLLNDEIKRIGVNKENSRKTILLLEKLSNIEPVMSIISSTISILSNFI